MLDRIKRKLLFSIGIGAVVFLLLSFYADWEALADALLRFDAHFIPLVLLLALGNYGLRFLRWQVYLRVLAIDLAWRESLVVFLAGLVLSVTPGKAGELLKAYFIKQVPISQSVPAVLCERLTDLIALVFLALVGVSAFDIGLMPLIGAGLFLGSVLLVLSWPRAVRWIIDCLVRLPILSKFDDVLRTTYLGMVQLISLRTLFLGLGLSVMAWFAECAGFYWVLKGFGATTEVVAATFIYGFATLFGAVTMLPGGLGTTEGSMVGLLALDGVIRTDAVGATLIIRLCTLWFAVAIGAYVLLRHRRYFEWEMEPDGEPGVLEKEMG